MARDDVEQLTFSIPQYARAVGISERQARYLLSRGELEGAVRIGHRVLVLRQTVIDALLRAAGADPYPEALDDQAAEAAEAEEQRRGQVRADAKGRRHYLETVAVPRGDELSPDDAALVR